MNPNLKISRIVAAILVVNAAGLLLRHFNLDTYIIIAGFRFHLSLILPLIIISGPGNLSSVKNILKKPPYNKTFQPLGWIFIPFLILIAALYLAKKIEIGDPEYFYEFGLSSVVDYPVYLVWNLFQLIAFALFLILTSSLFKRRFLSSVIIVLLVFAYEFVPVDKSKLDLFGLVSFFISAVITGLLINYFQNIYWFSIIIFTIFWCNLLAFGSQSQMFIHILFAARYTGWEGFFDVAKNYPNYLLPVQLGLTALLIAVSAVIKEQKSKNSFQKNV